MNPPPFHNELGLLDQAEKLGKQALQQGLIPSLWCAIFPIVASFIFLMNTGIP